MREQQNNIRYILYSILFRMIEENDGLPQRVCVRCLGTLEFLCDFYERCHLTQKEFSEAQNEKTNETKADFTEESDAESDKENALPSPNNMKRKVKISSSDNTKAIKSCLNENNIHQSETNNYKNSSNIEPAMQTTLQLNNHLTNKESMVDIIVPEEKEEDKNLHVVKYENHAPKKEYACKKILRRSIRSLNNSINKEKSRKSESNISTTTLEKSIRRKRGRISLNRSTVKRGIKKNLDNKKSEDPTKIHSGQPMRHCLRTICINKSNTLDTVALKLKMQSLSVEPTIKTNEHDSTTNNCLSTESSTKSKAVSVIVKQEKTEIEDSLSQQAIKFPWAPSEMLIQNPENPQKDNVVTHMSPPPGDEAERDKTCDSDSTIDNKTLNHSDIPDSAEMNELRPVSFQNRITVIKSSQTGEIIVPDILAHTDLSNIESTMDQSTRDSLESDFAERPFSRRSSRNNSISENKSKDVRFGKISELISDEQKETIETYYKVDMSVVNSDEVTKHITIIDKKNIKCNICGTLYPRIDKCQVHIWGHLEIKPYQCKACDFATVTVSNVRCHIRKSHLKIKPFACYLCEKKYVTSVLLEEHLNTHTGARPFKCGICDFASASRQMLSYHNTTHRSTKDFNCKVCSRQFYSRSRLRAHMRIHNKDKVVMCKLCSAYLSNVEALETHHKNIHMQDYICNVCGKRVKSKKALYNHRNVHAAAKYKCPKCPNIYKSRQILKDHLLKHEGIRKYKCDVCEKSFAQQSHLAAHMAVHSKIRFHCPGCERAFNRHDNMKMHTKRCKLFLANPDLQNLITRKERSKSMNKVKQLDTNCAATDTYKSIRPVKSQTEVVIDTEKTDANLCKLGLNISCIEPRSESWDHDVQNAAEIMNSVEADMIHITRIDNDVIPENGNLTVRENILGPEHF